jgi:hypothetical protein
MFRENKQQQQPSFFNSDLMMPDKMRQQLHGSWAGVFRTEVFMNIPEDRFAVLYSETDSRPNAPSTFWSAETCSKTGSVGAMKNWNGICNSTCKPGMRLGWTT